MKWLYKKSDVDALMKKKSTLIDMRSPVLYRDGTYMDAPNLPLMNFCNNLFSLDKSKNIILIVDSSDDADIKTAINYANQLGFEKLYVVSYEALALDSQTAPTNS